MDDNTVNKRISFYKLTLRMHEKDINPLDVFSCIEELPFIKDGQHLVKGGRYLPVTDGNFHLMHIDNKHLPLKISLGTSRRKNLPSTEKDGVVSDLKIDAGLFEPTHAMIFDNNIMGIESNYYGPKPASLQKYIQNKASPLVDTVEITPLMRSDYMDYISKIGDIKILEFKVHRNMTKHFEGITKSINHILNGMKDTTTAEFIGVSLNSTGRKGMLLNWKNDFLELFEDDEAREAAKKAFIKATDVTTNEIRDFNLLEPYFINSKKVLKNDDSHRSVNRKSMFKAINDSYYELKDEIDGITEIHKKKEQTNLFSFS